MIKRSVISAAAALAATGMLISGPSFAAPAQSHFPITPMEQKAEPCMPAIAIVGIVLAGTLGLTTVALDARAMSTPRSPMLIATGPVANPPPAKVCPRCTRRLRDNCTQGW